MLNPIAKFSLIFAYLLNLSGALILALGLADVLKIVRWRIFEQFDVLPCLSNWQWAQWF